MKLLLLLAHSIEEYDQVRLLSGLGHDVFSIGAYTNPAEPADDARPALPEVPYHEELARLVDGDQMAHKAYLPADLIDWADAIIVHHFERTWIGGQWPRIRGKRVIWRTVGQSGPANELAMAPLRRQGLQIVRYSPKERAIPGFAGEDALIRFWKDPDEWSGWTGDDGWVLNITQDLMARGEATNGQFYMDATVGLPRRLVGSGSLQVGGIGRVSFPEMQQELRRARAYLYTGTQPASYTLGLIEALMTGTPVVSIGPEHMTWSHGLLFEGHELAEVWSDDPAVVNRRLRTLLDEREYADSVSAAGRRRAIETFGRESVARAWAEFLR